MVVQVELDAIFCSLTNSTQDMNQIAGTQGYISLLPTYTSITVSSCIEHSGSIQNYLAIT